MSIGTSHGEKIIKDSDGAVVLVPARSARLAATVSNFSSVEFRYTLSDSDLPTQTHGLHLMPGETKNVNAVLNYDHKDPIADSFVEAINVIVIGSGEGQIDWVEVFDTTP